LFSGWLLAFTLSLDDVVLANFLSGPGATTLPVQVFSLVAKGRATPEVNALATIMIALVSVAALVAWWLMSRDEKRRQRDMQLALQQED
ncbi:MAG TPA: putrescine ABC transporter permease PotI, partial [Arenimonas sp.]|nr:putrescine ABC transporter permease PotI [Arenimonas sp.]